MELHGQETNAITIKSLWQTIHNLMGVSDGDPTVLSGKAINEHDLDEMKKTSGTAFLRSHSSRMILCYLFSDFKKAQLHADACKALVDSPIIGIDFVTNLLFEVLTMLANLGTSGKQKKTLDYVKKRIERVKYWAQQSPYNFLGSLYILDAELAVATGDHAEAFSKYVCAISLSKDSGSMLRTALANERAGKYFFERGQKKESKRFIDEAVAVYEKWGASAKAKHLRDELRFVKFT